ncbi:YhjD/YihY/BrkB family envelope integrity protein, partial [Kaarinaea lacus]
ASVMGSEFVKELMTYEGIGWLITVFARLLPYFLVIAAFTVIYIFVPNTRVTVKAAFAGACVAGVLWETVGWAFASFVVSSAKYTAIYSAFATLIFFMIWLYLCWMILLIGASIAFYVQNPEFRTPGEQTEESSSIRMREKLALLIMSAISRAFYADDKPMDEKALAETLDITPALLNPVIEQLISSHVLLRTEGETAGMVPAHPPETISVLDVLKVIRKSGEANKSSFSILSKDAQVDSCLANVDFVLEKELAEINLKHLALGDSNINR